MRKNYTLFPKRTIRFMITLSIHLAVEQDLHVINLVAGNKETCVTFGAAGAWCILNRLKDENTSVEQT